MRSDNNTGRALSLILSQIPLAILLRLLQVGTEIIWLITIQPILFTTKISDRLKVFRWTIELAMSALGDAVFIYRLHVHWTKVIFTYGQMWVKQKLYWNKAVITVVSRLATRIIQVAYSSD